MHGISQEAFALIVDEEVTSEAVCNRRYLRRTLPGEQSGATGEIGYDFGQQSAKQVIADWSVQLPPAMIKALTKCSGVTGQAAGMALQLRNAVAIPWDAGLEVFLNHDVRYAAMMRAALPGVDRLSPHCQGALLPITFNRGASYGKPGRAMPKCSR